MKTYLLNIANTISTFSQGLKLTMLHFFQAKTMRDPIGVKDENYFEKQEGIMTLQYPFEELPVPDNGRYQLHNEIDDCIVCDKCAKVCPVNCIDIEPVRAVDEIGKTSDGTSKRIYAAKFDIDMAKCCFCGLCTTVCPTECLTMTKEYDFSVFDLNEHNFVFGNMSEGEIVEKKEEFEKFNLEKQKEKEAKVKPVAEDSTESIETVEKKKPTFKPKVKSTSDGDVAKKPVFKPRVKPASESGDTAQPAKPAFRPKVKTKSSEADSQNEAKPTKPVFRPKIKSKSSEGNAEAKPDKADDSVAKKKPAFRPKVKAKPKADESEIKPIESDEIIEKKKPAFRPKIKVKDKPEEAQSNADATEATGSEEKKSKKPVFRPKIKPKK